MQNSVLAAILNVYIMSPFSKKLARGANEDLFVIMIFFPVIRISVLVLLITFLSRILNGDMILLFYLIL